MALIMFNTAVANTNRKSALLISLILLFSALPGLAQVPTSEFVRFVPGDQQWQGNLQTAIVSYEDDTGRQLDLVAAVHIAEPAYYQALNDYFKPQDAVLYELVAEPDNRPTPGITPPDSPLSFIQRMLANFLDVSFQLEHVDYLAENFIHADLSPAELAEIMAAKNETFFSMFFSLAMTEMASEQAARAAGESSPSAFTYLSLLNAMAAEDRGQAFKFLFASELGRSDSLLFQPEMEQSLTILGDRNQAALQVLDLTLAQDTVKRLSIFYGAAHMPGLERAITGQLGFRRTGQIWLDAWQIP